MAERTLTAMQRIAVRAVMKLKHLQTTKKGSGPGLDLELDDNGGTASPPPPFLAIFTSKARN